MLLVALFLVLLLSGPVFLNDVGVFVSSREWASTVSHTIMLFWFIFGGDARSGARLVVDDA